MPRDLHPLTLVRSGVDAGVEGALRAQVQRDLRRDSTYRRLMREAKAEYDREMGDRKSDAAARLADGKSRRRADGSPRGVATRFGNGQRRVA